MKRMLFTSLALSAICFAAATEGKPSKAEKQAKLQGVDTAPIGDTPLEQASAAATAGDTVSETTGDAAPADRKSIVPTKYAGKYKNGGSDALAEFIKAQCTVENNFVFDRFFTLCADNGIAEEHIVPYEKAIEAKAHGAQGRARMTLRNRLATIARKEGGLKGMDGEKVAIEMPALPTRTPKASAPAEGEPAAA